VRAPRDAARMVEWRRWRSRGERGRRRDLRTGDVFVRDAVYSRAIRTRVQPARTSPARGLASSGGTRAPLEADGLPRRYDVRITAGRRTLQVAEYNTGRARRQAARLGSCRGHLTIAAVFGPGRRSKSARFCSRTAKAVISVTAGQRSIQTTRRGFSSYSIWRGPRTRVRVPARLPCHGCVRTRHLRSGSRSSFTSDQPLPEGGRYWALLFSD